VHCTGDTRRILHVFDPRLRVAQSVGKVRLLELCFQGLEHLHAVSVVHRSIESNIVLRKAEGKKRGNRRGKGEEEGAKEGERNGKDE
jgi:hypothetical protein